MSATLKPCPHCVGEAQLVRYDGARTYVTCADCGARGPSVHFGSPNADGEHQEGCREQAIAGWNRRADGWQEPTDEQVNSACMSYRHDFGLLPELDRQALRRTAKFWFEAWAKEFEAEAAAAYWKGAYERMAARNIALNDAVSTSLRALDDFATGRGLFKPIEQIIADVKAKAATQ